MAQNKIGRPPSDNPLKDRIFVLVDDETKQKLKECRESLEATTSDVVRKGIDMVHGSLKK
uniref:CopG family transcriptional regulator n=1 Tax=Candidatus Fimivicinus sp. TaxID=3056640 RepID=UPI003FEF0218